MLALAAQRLSIYQFDSAKLIMNDFRLSSEELKISAKPQIQPSYFEWERQTIRLLNQYVDYLKYFKKMYVLKIPDEPIHYLFTESIHTINCIEYYLDILTCEPLEVRQAFLTAYVNRLDEFKRIHPMRGDDL